MQLDSVTCVWIGMHPECGKLPGHAHEHHAPTNAGTAPGCPSGRLPHHAACSRSRLPKAAAMSRAHEPLPARCHEAAAAKPKPQRSRSLLRCLTVQDAGAHQSSTGWDGVLWQTGRTRCACAAWAGVGPSERPCSVAAVTVHAAAAGATDEGGAGGGVGRAVEHCMDRRPLGPCSAACACPQACSVA